MRALPIVLTGLTLLLAPAWASAQPEQLRLMGEDDRIDAMAAPFISIDALDLEGRSRFHLSTRFTFDDGADTFSRSSLFVYELHAAIRLTDGLALYGTLPFGLDAPSPGPNAFFVGNLRVGLGGGTLLHLGDGEANPNTPAIGLGGGLDLYAPTAPSLQTETPVRGVTRSSVDIVRYLRSYDPELYLSRTATTRIRGQADIRINIFKAQIELGLAPAFTAEKDSRFMVFFHWLFRAAVQPIPAIEPYLELGSTLQIVGEAEPFDLTIPVHATFGARAHFGAIDPALFVSIDLKNGTPIFGIDLAGVLRGGRQRDEGDLLDF